MERDIRQIAGGTRRQPRSLLVPLSALAAVVAAASIVALFGPWQQRNQSGLGTFPNEPVESLPPDVAARLQAVVDAHVDPGTGPGIAAAVISGFNGAWRTAAGTSDGISDLHPEAQFAIGSITKTVVAAQVLELVDRGLVDLDQPMQRYLPTDADHPTNGAVVRDVLAMRSGIAEYDDGVVAGACQDLAASTDLASIAEAIPTAAEFEPGAQFRYSASNYVIAGLLVEHVTGSSIAVALRAGVLAAADLQRLIYQDAERPTQPVALPFSRLIPGDLTPAALWTAGGGYLPARCVAGFGPVGGMASDAMTLARWAYRVFGDEVLSEESLDQMTAFRDGYGLGLADYTALFGVSAYGHAGLVPGYRAQFIVLPEQAFVVVVLTNTDDDDPDPMAIAKQLVQALDRAR